MDKNEFLSKGRATPFEGMDLFAKTKLTIANGKVAYIEKELTKDA